MRTLLPHMTAVMLYCHRVLSYLWMTQHCLHCVCDEQDVARTRDDDQKPIHYLQQETRVNMQHCTIMEDGMGEGVLFIINWLHCNQAVTR